MSDLREFTTATALVGEDDDEDGAFGWRRMPLPSKGEIETRQSGLHPFRQQWVFWTWLSPGDGKWRDGLGKQCVLDSIEDLCALQSRIKPLNQLGAAVSYFFFKSGIEPSWEHPLNEMGGSIELKAGIDRLTKLDRMLVEVLETVLGQQLEDRQQEAINGVEANNRTVRIWLNTCEASVVNPIGDALISKLNLLQITNKPKFEEHACKMERDVAKKADTGWDEYMEEEIILRPRPVAPKQNAWQA